MSSSNNMPDLGSIAIITLVEQDLLNTYNPLVSKKEVIDSPRKKSKKEEKN
jgi:hypothetical protein